MSPLIDIVSIEVLCFAAWGFFYLALHRRGGIGYRRGFLATTAYFLAVAIFMAGIFWPYLAGVLNDFSPAPLVVLGLFMAGQALLYFFLPHYLPNPADYLQRFPDRYFLEIDWRRLISKSADILAQQVFIVLLVVLLRDLGLSGYLLLIAFGCLFMLLHVPLILSARGAWPSWLFGGIVIVFSAVFPILILDVSYGFVYNIILHWIFYTATAVVFWIRYEPAAEGIASF